MVEKGSIRAGEQTVVSVRSRGREPAILSLTRTEGEPPSPHPCCSPCSSPPWPPPPWWVHGARRPGLSRQGEGEGAYEPIRGTLWQAEPAACHAATKDSGRGDPVDADGDGYHTEEDCDDTDPERHGEPDCRPDSDSD